MGRVFLLAGGSSNGRMYARNITSCDPVREIAPRHTVDLKSWVMVTGVGNAGTEGEHYHFLRGKTKNVSISGVALVLAAEDVLELQGLGSEFLLRLMIPLPSQPIEVEVLPVRYQCISADPQEGIVVGAKIVNISAADLALYEEFIAEQEVSKLS